MKKRTFLKMPSAGIVVAQIERSGVSQAQLNGLE